MQRLAARCVQVRNPLFGATGWTRLHFRCFAMVAPSILLNPLFCQAGVAVLRIVAHRVSFRDLPLGPAPLCDSVSESDILVLV